MKLVAVIYLLATVYKLAQCSPPPTIDKPNFGFQDIYPASRLPRTIDEPGFGHALVAKIKDKITQMPLVGKVYSMLMGEAKQLMGDMDDVHFLLWTRSNPDDDAFYELKIDDTSNLAASPFNANLPTYVLVHGWTDSGRDPALWPVQAKTELLKNYDCNVITIDWGDIATLHYAIVHQVLDKIGKHSADFLDYLHNYGSLNITNNLHVVGHSLGAQLSGFIGASIGNGPIGRITGLDPAGPGYAGMLDIMRLDKTDATFVDVIHTNGCPLIEACHGIRAASGHADYYPNGGEHQPNCTDDVKLDAYESHQRAPVYWIESINPEATPFTSHLCSDWAAYLDNECSSAAVQNMGLHSSTKVSGKYFLKTNGAPPFAQGQILEKTTSGQWDILKFLREGLSHYN